MVRCIPSVWAPYHQSVHSPAGSSLVTTTTALPDLDGLDLVEFGARSGLLFRRPGLTLAGLGVATTIALERPSGAKAAQEALAALRGPNAMVDQPGSGPVAFGALPFDRTMTATLIVPEIVLGQNDAGDTWLSITTEGSPNPAAVLGNILSVARRPIGVPDPGSPWSLTSVISPQQWRDEIVTTARNRIASGELNKAVMAREAIFASAEPIDPARVVVAVADTFATANVFNVNGFIGASPELLVSRLGNTVQAHPLAGTAPRSDDPAEDKALAAELLASGKNRSEHQITIDWFLNELLPFCSYVDAEPEPSIMSLANVHHLGTLVEGLLSSPPASVLELVEATHPTPAVGGDPQDIAIDVINEVEDAERGLYAGATGWVDGAGNGAFAVNVRCAHIIGNRASVFSGVGVVAESDPQAELDETRAKYQAMLRPLLAPWPGADEAIATI